jgi:hypothetical protein
MTFFWDLEKVKNVTKTMPHKVMMYLQAIFKAGRTSNPTTAQLFTMVGEELWKCVGI